MNAGDAPQQGDDKLVELIRRTVADHDAVPVEAVAAAREAWTWRTIDAELAELSHDSLLDDTLVGVRGAATVRALSFEAGSVFIELEVGGSADAVDLVGQVMPAGAGTRLVLEGADGRPAAALPVDDLGRFSAEALAPGLVRLVVSGAATATVVTEWTAI